jgi:hypothetical protein
MTLGWGDDGFIMILFCHESENGGTATLLGGTFHCFFGISVYH